MMAMIVVLTEIFIMAVYCIYAVMFVTSMCIALLDMIIIASMACKA